MLQTRYTNLSLIQKVPFLQLLIDLPLHPLIPLLYLFLQSPVDELLELGESGLDYLLEFRDSWLFEHGDCLLEVIVCVFELFDELAEEPCGFDSLLLYAHWGGHLFAFRAEQRFCLDLHLNDGLVVHGTEELDCRGECLEVLGVVSTVLEVLVYHTIRHSLSLNIL